MSELAGWFRDVADRLEALEQHPYGPDHTTEDRQVAGQACLELCDGDQDRARTLWKMVVSDCGGYMPHAAACALIRASRTGNLVPDVEAPVPS